MVFRFTIEQREQLIKEERKRRLLARKHEVRVQSDQITRSNVRKREEQLRRQEAIRLQQDNASSQDSSLSSLSSLIHVDNRRRSLRSHTRPSPSPKYLPVKTPISKKPRRSSASTQGILPRAINFTSSGQRGSVAVGRERASPRRQEQAYQFRQQDLQRSIREVMRNEHNTMNKFRQERMAEQDQFEQRRRAMTLAGPPIIQTRR